ncbi:unnamed protein product [Arctogadus glacialis]
MCRACSIIERTVGVMKARWRSTLFKALEFDSSRREGEPTSGTGYVPRFLHPNNLGSCKVEGCEVEVDGCEVEVDGFEVEAGRWMAVSASFPPRLNNTTPHYGESEGNGDAARGDARGGSNVKATAGLQEEERLSLGDDRVSPRPDATPGHDPGLGGLRAPGHDPGLGGLSTKDHHGRLWDHTAPPPAGLLQASFRPPSRPPSGLPAPSRSPPGLLQASLLPPGLLQASFRPPSRPPSGLPAPSLLPPGLLQASLLPPGLLQASFRPPSRPPSGLPAPSRSPPGLLQASLQASFRPPCSLQVSSRPPSGLPPGLLQALFSYLQHQELAQLNGGLLVERVEREERVERGVRGERVEREEREERAEGDKTMEVGYWVEAEGWRLQGKCWRVEVD